MLVKILGNNNITTLTKLEKYSLHKEKITCNIFMYFYQKHNYTTSMFGLLDFNLIIYYEPLCQKYIILPLSLLMACKHTYTHTIIYSIIKSMVQKKKKYGVCVFKKSVFLQL